MATGNSNQASTPYSGRFAPLQDDFQEAKGRKRVRRFTNTPPSGTLHATQQGTDRYYKAWLPLGDFNRLDNDDKLSSFLTGQETVIFAVMLRPR